MKDFHHKRLNSGLGKSRMLLIALATILAGGGAFAAVGGTDSVRQLFITLKIIGPNGQEVHDLVVEKIDPTGDPSVVNLDLGEGRTATMQIEHMVTDGGDVVEGAQVQVQLGIDDNINNRAFVTNDVVGTEGMNATIEIQMSDDGEGAGTALSTQSLTISGMEGMQVVTTMTDGENTDAITRAFELGAAMRRIGHFPKHVGTFDLDEAEIIHSWVDEDGAAFDLIMYGIMADDGNGDVYLFKTYEGDDGQRIYDSIGQMTGVDPEVLEVTDVRMEGSAITLAFDNDGQSITMIVNTDGDDMSFGEKSLTIEN